MRLQKSTVITVEDILNGVNFDVRYVVESNEFIIKIEGQELVVTGEQMDRLSEMINKIIQNIK